MYEIQKNVTRLDNGQPTFFLDLSEAKEVKRKFGKNRFFLKIMPFLCGKTLTEYL